MYKRTLADNIVQQAYNNALLSLIIEPMITTAFDMGYKLTLSSDCTKTINFTLSKISDRAKSIETLLLRLDADIKQVTGGCITNPPSKINESDEGKQEIVIIVWCGEGRAYVVIEVIPDEHSTE